MTAEVAIAPLTREEAASLTERIRVALDRVASSWSDLSERVAEAFERRADVALGYESWAEYADAELKPSSTLAVEVRRELVGLLSARGMSTRAIAPAVGVAQKTVVKDRQVIPEVSPEPMSESEFINALADVEEATFEQALVDARTDDDLSRENVVRHVAKPAPVKGLDGKTYTKPTISDADRRARDNDYWAKKNAEQSIRSTCEALATLEDLSHPNTRARKIAEFPAHSDATRPHAREKFTPASMRQIADWLNTFANELEAAL